MALAAHHMTLEETQFFMALDAHSRTRHRCFLAEMFLSKNGTEYCLCFRPTDENPKSVWPYACKYLRINREEAFKIGRSKTLSDATAGLLDRELPELFKSTS